MVIVRLTGGIGNQLFQYAFGRRMALDRGVPLKFDFRRYKAEYLRRVRLDQFATHVEAATEREIDRLRPRTARARERLVWLERVLPLRWFSYIEETRNFHFDPRILDARRQVYLHGYWQTWRYFEPIADLIRAEFQFAQPPDADNQAVAVAIEAGEAVSLHIRRGDYADDPKANRRFGVLPPDYYERAAAHIAAKVTAPRFFVFSDDPAWVREHLRLPHPLTVVSHNGPDRDTEDLRLMTLCRHHIIANSTFSWWGAWLGHNPARLVVAPARWYLNIDRPTPDLLPPDWTRL